MRQRWILRSARRRTPTTHPALRVRRLMLEPLEDRITPATTPLTFAVVGDYGVASSILNVANIITGAPEPEGNVARLIHSWSPDFVVSLGDNNYLCGEQQDVNIIQALELLVLGGYINPSTAQSILDDLVNVPTLGVNLKGDLTNGSAVVTNLSSTSKLQAGMVVVDQNVPLFTTVQSVDSATQITLSANATATLSQTTIGFLPGDISLTSIDGLSHIDRNIGRFYSDFIYPYVSSSPGGAFGNGSPTGFNHFFPVPGNHDWADIFSDNNANGDSDVYCVLANRTTPNLDPYLTLFAGLNPTNSPGLTLGTGLTQPYYYSYTVGTQSNGKPLIEFFAVDSDPADPNLLNGNDPTTLTPAEVEASPEGQWLKNAMLNSQALYKIPYFHHSPYSSSEEPDEGPNGTWMQLPFQQWGATAVLYGHVHNYERFDLPDPGGSVPIPYFLNGLGGAPITAFTTVAPGSQLRYNGEWGAMKVVADEQRITFQFINDLGGLIDQYTIDKTTTAAGADAGGQPQVKIYNGDGSLRTSFFAYDPRFGGGVRVASADFTGDGVPDIVTGAGPGGGPHVRLFNGADGSEIVLNNNPAFAHGFFAFEPTWSGGIYVAAGDINGDGTADIVVSRDQGGAPEVKVFSGKDGSVLADFNAYNPLFPGGVRVAVADTNGDGRPDIITGAGPGGGPHVEVFDGTDLTHRLRSFMAYEATFAGGVYVSGQSLGAGLAANIVTGPGAGHTPLVKVFPGLGGTPQQFLAFDQNFLGGVRVGDVGDRNGDSVDDLIVAAGPGGGPHVKILDGKTFTTLDSFYAFNAAFAGGVFVGGS